MKTITLVAWLAMLSSSVEAQRVVNHQALYWTRYQNQILLSSAVYWSNEIDNRRFFNPDVENQLIIHSHFHYKRKRWDFGAGPTTSWSFAQKPEVGYSHAVNELRLMTEVNYELPLGKVYFQNRLRLDHRFIQKDAEKSVFDESVYVLRFRYRVQCRIPLKKNSENVTTMNLKIADELMLNHTKNTFDQNRIYTSIDFYASKKISIELGYIYIYQQRFGADEFFARHVARFTVLHKMGSLVTAR